MSRFFSAVARCAAALAVITVAGLFGVPAAAQHIILPPSALAPSVDDDGAASPAAGSKDDSATRVNPLLGIGIISEADFKPLTRSQRWELYLKQNFLGPSAYFRALGPSLGDHFGENPPEWGTGASGFGKRFASRFATNTVSESIEAVIAAAAGQDTRYIRSAKKGFWKRSGHAILFNFVTLNNEGKKRIAVGRITGAYAGSVIATTWMPDRFTWRDGLRDGHQQMAFGGIINLVREFWPEISRRFRR